MLYPMPLPGLAAENIVAPSARIARIACPQPHFGPERELQLTRVEGDLGSGCSRRAAAATGTGPSAVDLRGVGAGDGALCEFRSRVIALGHEHDALGHEHELGEPQLPSSFV